MDRWLQGGRMWGEWTFRSRYLGIYEFSKDLNRSDWRLIHKHEEPKMTECHNRTMPLLKVNDSFPLPPLQVRFGIEDYIDSMIQRFLTQMSTRAKGQTKERATLDLSIDPQFEMIKKFIEKTSPTKKAESPYEETVPETFLSLYGNILPVKVDSWSLDPANYRYHFDTKDNKK
jgi:hypothetical protein